MVNYKCQYELEIFMSTSSHTRSRKCLQNTDYFELNLLIQRLKEHYRKFRAKNVQIILLAVIDFELILFRPSDVLRFCIEHVPWRFSARNHF